MDIDTFRADLETKVINANYDFGHGKPAAFAEEITKLMQDAEYLNGDFQESFFMGNHPKDKRKKFRIDGWLRDEADSTLILFIVYYSDGDANMTKALAEENFKKLETFFDAIMTTDICADIDESTSTAELAENLKARADEKFKFILLTNARRSLKLREVKNLFIRGREIECQIWDIERIFDVYNSLQVREPIKIDFEDGLPCLRAADTGNDCESFLCVIPGKILADIYDKYGSRLLEGNVRSFLSTKCAVNKKIQATILNKPEMFFAFNNGIAATAKELEINNFGNGLFIMSATDFQIINGGQTTALLLNARLKRKSSLEKIFVQMKLTRIGDMPIEAQEKLIGEISRSSNSQNKVSEADFFSTHPFHVEMEKISRRLFAPPQAGFLYQTKWFYERARGQYVQEQIKMTPAQQKNFQRENPKAQVMAKTDFAKYRMSWEEKPNIVSKGAQTNFVKFAEETSATWEKNPAQFNEYYFKETVALAIIFHAVEKLVSAQEWYKISKSYRANVVTYSLALFHNALKKKFPDSELNLLAIWKLQKMPAAFESIFEELTFAVNNFITGKRPITNVTQWCKQAPCWENMKNTLHLELPKNFSEWMLGQKEIKAEKKSARTTQQISFEVDAQAKILSFSGATWRRISDDASRKNLLAQDEKSALSTAMKIPEKIPSPLQCEKLLRLLGRLEENGLTYAADATL